MCKTRKLKVDASSSKVGVLEKGSKENKICICLERHQKSRLFREGSLWSWRNGHRDVRKDDVNY